MRAALLLVLGLVIGVIGTVFSMNALRDRNPLPHSVMVVMSHHLGELSNSVKTRQCDAAKTHTQLSSLLMISQDIGPAFPGVDKPFLDAADKLHDTVQAAALVAPVDCPALALALKPIGEACHSCHQQYR